MKTSILSALTLSLALGSACGVDQGAAAPAVDYPPVTMLRAALVNTTGISANATYQEVVTGTPTYGFPATTPVLTAHVEVDDAALRSAFPTFDGLEQPSVLFPVPQDGSVVWNTARLHYSGQTQHGYYGEIKIDLYDSDSLWNVDWATLHALGVAIRLDTNVGVIWGQEVDHNVPVVRK